MWRHLWNVFKWTFGFYGESTPAPPLCVVVYRGYEARITDDSWFPARPTYGAIAYDTERVRMMDDGGTSDAPKTITVGGCESRSQAGRAVRMEIDAALDN